ncbi:MAG: diguanylate cyclase, partial [Burkholderiaceae bacterium]|nr:diguanylate cyclase [Burkholderiaceae bacterium]
MSRRVSPLVQLTVALVALTGSLVLLAEVFLGLMPDREQQLAQTRKLVAESLAVQVAAMLSEADAPTLERMLRDVAERTPQLQTVAVRRVDRSIAVQAGAHQARWRDEAADDLASGQLRVPLYAGQARWGWLEVAFEPVATHPLLRWLRQPVVLLLLFITVTGTLVFGLYLRRALHHLDPSSVVPERVRQAYDALTAGVVVLDTDGRLLLANRAFRGLHPEAAQTRSGQALSALPWLAAALAPQAAQHPWSRVLAGGSAEASAQALSLPQPAGEPRRLVTHCAPIADVGGHVRGCLVIFDDTTALHEANAALRSALADLSQAKAEVEQKNEELRRLATRDPLTGSLNRRAFHPAFERLMQQARAEGRAVSVLMVDIDRFKSINDAHGHGIGDRVIQQVVRKLQEGTRSDDLVCRFGGEEFCVVTAGLNAAEAREFGERLRQRVERECAAGLREVAGLRVTVSVGVATCSALEAGSQLIEQADHALYAAKRGGRNRVEVFGGEPAAGSDAERDPLTGCLTAAALRDAFDARLQSPDADDVSLGCCVLTLDDPARRPSTQSLQAVAHLLNAHLLPGDLLGRHGDDGFCLIAVARLSQMQARAESIRAAVAGWGVARQAAGGALLTLSVGVDALSLRASGATTLIDRADQARSRALRAGG